MFVSFATKLVETGSTGPQIQLLTEALFLFSKLQQFLLAKIIDLTIFYPQSKTVSISYMVLCWIREFLENTVTILKAVNQSDLYSTDMKQQVLVLYRANVIKVGCELICYKLTNG